MSHPYHEHRQTRKEHSRVGHITRGYKSGGAVKGEKTIGKSALALHKKEHAALRAEGDKSKHRMDRPHRAKGGKVKGKQHNAKTIVNVIAGGHPAGGVVPPGPPMAPPGQPMGIAPAAAPPSPMAAKPSMPMPAPGAMPPGGPMPMRARGGKVKHRADGGASDQLPNPFMPSGRPAPSQDDFANILKSNPKLLRILQNASKPGKAAGGKVRHRDSGGGLDNDFMSKSISDPATKIPGKLRNPFGYGKIKTRSPIPISGPTPVPVNEYARGGGVKHGPTWEEGRKNGTQVQHHDGKDDQKDIGRRRVVTFLAGGRVKKDCGGPAQTPTRAKGGRVGRDAVAPATKLPGGSGGGEARLVKAHRAEHKG